MKLEWRGKTNQTPKKEKRGTSPCLYIRSSGRGGGGKKKRTKIFFEIAYIIIIILPLKRIIYILLLIGVCGYILYG